ALAAKRVAQKEKLALGERLVGEAREHRECDEKGEKTRTNHGSSEPPSDGRVWRPFQDGRQKSLRGRAFPHSAGSAQAVEELAACKAVRHEPGTRLEVAECSPRPRAQISRASRGVVTKFPRSAFEPQGGRWGPPRPVRAAKPAKPAPPRGGGRLEDRPPANRPRRVFFS